ncbi:unnamed protein product [Ectocarpus fasciculatus]
MASRLTTKDLEIQGARSELDAAKHHFHRQYQQHEQQQQQQQRQHLQPQQQQDPVVGGVPGEKGARGGSVGGGGYASVRTSRASCEASTPASAPLIAQGRRGTGGGPRREVLAFNISLARQQQQQLQQLKALQQR